MGKGRILARDLRAILAFLRANYALEGHEGFISNVVHGLPSVVRSDLTAYCEIDPRQGTSENWLDRPEVDTPDAQRIWAEHMLEMPVVAHYVATGDGRALRITDFVSQGQFRQTGVYAEHYRPKRVQYVLATMVPSPGPAIGIGLHRDAKDFTDDERLLLGLLRPHLIQGWRNARLAGRLEREAQAAQALVASHPDVVVLDRRGAPVFVGERARSLFETHYGGVGPAGVPDEVLRWARAAASGLDTARDEVPSQVLPLTHETRDGRLTVRIFVNGAGATLAVHERREPDLDDRRPRGLTRRESEVLTWVAEGKTNRDIAMLLDCRPKTVEKHLEHIYAKLDVPNRAAAVAAFMKTAVATTH